MTTASTTSPTHITAENFEGLVINAEIPVLLDFWASWCVPCKLMRRAVEKTAEALRDQVLVGFVDVDRHPDLVVRYGVQGTPTFILIRDGQVIDRFTGIATSGGLARKIRDRLAED